MAYNPVDTLLTPWCQTSGFQNRINFCCFKPPVYGTLSQQPQETNTGGLKWGIDQTCLESESSIKGARTWVGDLVETWPKSWLWTTHWPGYSLYITLRTRLTLPAAEGRDGRLWILAILHVLPDQWQPPSRTGFLKFAALISGSVAIHSSLSAFHLLSRNHRWLEKERALRTFIPILLFHREENRLRRVKCVN